MKKLIVTLSLLLLVPGLAQAKKGALIKNESGESIWVKIDNGVKDWENLEAARKIFLETKKYDMRGIQWKTSTHKFTSKKYKWPEIFTIKKDNNYTIQTKTIEGTGKAKAEKAKAELIQVRPPKHEREAYHILKLPIGVSLGDVKKRFQEISSKWDQAAKNLTPEQERIQMAYEFLTVMLDKYTNKSAALKVLGLKNGASLDEIKKSYRKLSLKWHPDINADKEKATKMMETINEAYGLLTEKEKLFKKLGLGVNASEDEVKKAATAYNDKISASEILNRYFDKKKIFPDEYYK